MKTRAHWMLAPLAVLALTACQTQPAASTAGTAAEETTPQLAREDRLAMQSYRIRDWSAPSNDVLIVESIDGTRYRAQFMGPCTGLRFANTIGFITRGTNELDRFAGIVLPDGTRCQFSSFQRAAPATAVAEGADEPARVEKPQGR